jgi:hypothetical protein
VQTTSKQLSHSNIVDIKVCRIFGANLNAGLINDTTNPLLVGISMMCEGEKKRKAKLPVSWYGLAYISHKGRPSARGSHTSGVWGKE